MVWRPAPYRITPPRNPPPLRAFSLRRLRDVPRAVPEKEIVMRAIGLWLLGVPLWLVIMLAIFTDWI